MYAFSLNSKKRDRTWQSRYDRLLHYTRELERVLYRQDCEYEEYLDAPRWLRLLFLGVAKLIKRGK